MKLACVVLALAVCGMAVACADKPQAPSPAPPAEAANEDNWEPGKDLSGTEVVIGGVRQVVPEDAAATKRKMDDVAADVTAQMDELERKRQQKFSADADVQP